MQRYTTLTQADLTATSATSSTTTTTARQGGTAGAAPGAAVQEGTADEGAGAGGAAAAQPLQQLPPLVINTPGWITGLGLDLLAEVLRCAQPTHGEFTHSNQCCKVTSIPISATCCWQSSFSSSSSSPQCFNLSLPKIGVTHHYCPAVAAAALVLGSCRFDY